MNEKKPSGRYSEKKFERDDTELLELMQDAFFQLDKNWNIIRVNRNQEKVSQTQRQDSLGKNFWELFPASANPDSNYWKFYHEVLEKQEPRNFEEYYAPLNLWTEVSAYPTKEGGIAVFFRDISERKKTEHNIQDSEEQFRRLANSISQLAWMADPDGWIYWYNQRWYDYTNTTLEEMEGWGWEKVHHPDHIERVVNFAKDAWQKGEPYELTFPLKRKDGVFRWFLTRIYPVKNNEGKVIQWIGTNTDIDDQKKALEQKDEFLSIASHELKTPVTSLKGFTQILQMKFEKEGNVQAVDLLSKMDKQVNKLTRLIVDLLDVTKIENGQLAFSEDDFDFNILIKEIAEEMQLTSESHKIVYDISDTIVVNGDRNRIGQVITNLISNAIKYSPDANEILLSTSIENQHIKLCVTDFGIGIPLEKNSNIFNRFYRVSGDKENTFPGLGLGLFISAEIIKRHNGKIYLESAKGKGSTFCFMLPVNVAK